MKRPAVQGRDDIGRAPVPWLALAVVGWLGVLAGCGALGPARPGAAPPTSPPSVGAQGATAQATKATGADPAPALPPSADTGASPPTGGGTEKPAQAAPLDPSGAPAVPGPEAASPTPPGGHPETASEAEPKILLTLRPGLYRCELNRRVTVRRIDVQARTMVINWQGRDSTLTAVSALSGALRFENPGLGLVWITIVGKSLLLDSKAGKTLANECRL